MWGPESIARRTLSGGFNRQQDMRNQMTEGNPSRLSSFEGGPFVVDSPTHASPVYDYAQDRLSAINQMQKRLSTVVGENQAGMWYRAAVGNLRGELQATGLTGVEVAKLFASITGGSFEANYDVMAPPTASLEDIGSPSQFPTRMGPSPDPPSSSNLGIPRMGAGANWFPDVENPSTPTMGPAPNPLPTPPLSGLPPQAQYLGYRPPGDFGPRY